MQARSVHRLVRLRTERIMGIGLQLCVSIPSHRLSVSTRSLLPGKCTRATQWPAVRTPTYRAGNQTASDMLMLRLIGASIVARARERTASPWFVLEHRVAKGLSACFGTVSKIEVLARRFPLGELPLRLQGRGVRTQMKPSALRSMFPFNGTRSGVVNVACKR
jgi:hypothetical protein